MGFLYSGVSLPSVPRLVDTMFSDCGCYLSAVASVCTTRCSVYHRVGVLSVCLVLFPPVLESSHICFGPFARFRTVC